jgi:chloramphenicol 3-O-phosphotransferase
LGVLLLTGGSAVGKNTIGETLARIRERCAVIDVDILRHMVLQPHHAPWEGDEGSFQQRLGVGNACMLARNFIEAGFDVLILDILTVATAGSYREELAPHRPYVVLLYSTYEEALRRARSRPPVLSQQEFKLVYEQQSVFSEYDLKIDTTNMTPRAVATVLGQLLNGESTQE